jgi:hypothetical protein
MYMCGFGGSTWEGGDVVSDVGSGESGIFGTAHERRGDEGGVAGGREEADEEGEVEEVDDEQEEDLRVSGSWSESSYESSME